MEIPLPNYSVVTATTGTLSSDYNCFLLNGAGTYTLPPTATAHWRLGTYVWLKSIAGTATVASADTVEVGYTSLTAGQSELLVFTATGWRGLVAPNPTA